MHRCASVHLLETMTPGKIRASAIYPDRSHGFPLAVCGAQDAHHSFLQKLTCIAGPGSLGCSHVRLPSDGKLGDVITRAISDTRTIDERTVGGRLPALCSHWNSSGVVPHATYPTHSTPDELTSKNPPPLHVTTQGRRMDQVHTV